MRQSHESGGKRFAFGPFVKCPHPEMIEALALGGFDFAVVDMEHTPLGPRELYPLVLAAERRGMDLVVRIPENSEKYFKWCLDLGVRYVQVPFVQSRADAELALRKAYFHPDGERGLCRFTRAAGFSTTDRHEYVRGANEAAHLILQVEGRDGLDKIDEILSAGRIGTLFIGPYDLSQSLGRPGEIWHESVVVAMKTIIAACAKRGVAVGTFTDTPEGVAFWAEAGVTMIQYASDLSLMLGAAARLRSGFGGAGKL